MVTLVGQPVTVVAVAVAGGVGASGGVLDTDGEGVGSVGDGGGDVWGGVVLPVASMVRVLYLAIEGVTYVSRTLRWLRGCCR